MKFKQPQTLAQIADAIGARYVGEPNFLVEGINEIHRVEKGDIVFVDHPKYYSKALESQATVVLINQEVECPEGKALLISDDPFRDFVKIGQMHRQFAPSQAQISPTASIGKGTVVQTGAFIGNHVTIGENCLIHAGVIINDHIQIGNHVIIHSGTVLGGDAFYYKKRETGYDKLQSVGDVIIQDHVEIGANCTIDRGVTASTIIGEGSKLDNQIQIGHDTILGKKCLVASQVGIAGCCIIGDEVTLWGQVGVTSGVTIGKGAVISAKSGVSKSLAGGKLYMGVPAMEGREAYRRFALLNKIPELLQKIKG